MNIEDISIKLTDYKNLVEILEDFQTEYEQFTSLHETYLDLINCACYELSVYCINVQLVFYTVSDLIDTYYTICDCSDKIKREDMQKCVESMRQVKEAITNMRKYVEKLLACAEHSKYSAEDLETMTYLSNLLNRPIVKI